MTNLEPVGWAAYRGGGWRVHLTLEPSPTASRVCTQAPDSRLSPGSMSLVALVPLHRAAATGTRGCSCRDPRLQPQGPVNAFAGTRGCRAASCAREGRRDGETRKGGGSESLSQGSALKIFTRGPFGSPLGEQGEPRGRANGTGWALPPLPSRGPHGCGSASVRGRAVTL